MRKHSRKYFKYPSENTDIQKYSLLQKFARTGYQNNVTKSSVCHQLYSENTWNLLKENTLEILKIFRYIHKLISIFIN